MYRYERNHSFVAQPPQDMEGGRHMSQFKYSNHPQKEDQSKRGHYGNGHINMLIIQTIFPVQLILTGNQTDCTEISMQRYTVMLKEIIQSVGRVHQRESQFVVSKVDMVKWNFCCVILLVIVNHRLCNMIHRQSSSSVFMPRTTG